MTAEVKKKIMDETDFNRLTGLLPQALSFGDRYWLARLIAARKGYRQRYQEIMVVLKDRNKTAEADRQEIKRLKTLLDEAGISTLKKPKRREGNPDEYEDWRDGGSLWSREDV